MRDVNVTAENTVFSHDASSSDKLCCLEQYVLQDEWHKLKKVYLIESDKVPGKYIIYDGNHRFRLAIVFSKPLPGRLIENDGDLQEVIESSSGNTPWGNTYESVQKSIGRPICTEDTYPQYFKKEINWDTPNRERLQQILQQSE
jgi:hypothetical protein